MLKETHTLDLRIALREKARGSPALIQIQSQHREGSAFSTLRRWCLLHMFNSPCQPGMCDLSSAQPLPHWERVRI